MKKLYITLFYSGILTFALAINVLLLHGLLKPER